VTAKRWAVLAALFLLGGTPSVALAQTTPPAVAPPAAPAKPSAGRRATKPTVFRRQYLVFFQTGEATLQPTAREIVKLAADAAKKRHYSHLKVIGYSDAPGSAAAAQHLSELRAAAVRDELARDGIPADKIRAEGRGKHNPAIKTPNPEPRNRRVRIIIYLPGE
jgi:OOP family OmpA-OmpF porin